MNNRRTIVFALGAGALTMPFASFAQQQTKVWRVGILSPRAKPATWDRDNFGEVLKGLRDLGYVEGRNLTIEARFADGVYERLPALAGDLAKTRPDVIVTVGTPAVYAALQASTTIPIVAVSTGNPVGAGFAASLARPGGTVTGLTNIGDELIIKRLEVLVVIVPKVTRVAYLFNPDNEQTVNLISKLQAAARKVGKELVPITARTPADLTERFKLLARDHVGAVIVTEDAALNAQAPLISELASRGGIPTMFDSRLGVEAGGLVSYGIDTPTLYRRGATFVDKILKGAKPGDLPIEQPTKFELVINRKTAKALGITIPQELLLRADRLIE